MASLGTEMLDVFYPNTDTDRILVATKTGVIQCLRETELKWPLIHINFAEIEKEKHPVIKQEGPAEPAAPEAKPEAPKPPAGVDPFGAPAAAGPDPFGADQGGAKPPAGGAGGAAPPADAGQGGAAPPAAGGDQGGADPFGGPAPPAAGGAQGGAGNPPAATNDPFN
jgi:hypothetical protein